MDLINNRFLNLSNIKLPFTYSDDQFLTSLGENFAKKIQMKTGLEIKLAYVTEEKKDNLISFILLERGIPATFTNGDLFRFQGPITNSTMKTCPLSANIFESFKGSLDEYSIHIDLSGCGNIQFEIWDYNFVMRAAFFKSEYFVKIEDKIKNKYSDLAFCLRHKEGGQYYFIIDNSVISKNDMSPTLIETIVKDIQKEIEANDFLCAFTDTPPIAVITDYNQLKKNGEIMGIMRENLQFYNRY